MQKLKIVTDSDKSNKIFTADGLIFHKDRPDGFASVVDNQGSFQRAARISEVKAMTSERSNHVTMNKYVDRGTGLLYMKDPTFMDSYVLVSSNDDSSVTNNLLDIIKSYYSEELDRMKTSETSLYNSETMSIDILNGTVTFNLIRPGQYTRTLNLNKIAEYYAGINVTCRVSLVIQYTTNAVIYPMIQDFVFEAFTYTGETETTYSIVKETLSTPITDGIRLDYQDNLLKITPTNDDIKECFIKSCYITYGNCS